MATITSVGSGAWSSTDTWDSGVPVDGDDVVIASGHTVTFNVDQSAFTTGVKVTITGTLTHTTAAGNYCLFAKTGASIVGAGTWNIGTSGTPIPFAAKHTITGAAGWYVDGVAGLTMTVYGAEPSINYVKLSANEAAGQTELSVDTDVTGETNYWKAGDKIAISKAVGLNVQYYEIQSVTDTTITITSGLSVAKLKDDYITLLTRNIWILYVAPTTAGITRIGTGKLFIGGGLLEGTSAINCISATSGAAISGGCIAKFNHGISGGNSHVITGGCFIGNQRHSHVAKGSIDSAILISCDTWYGWVGIVNNTLIAGGNNLQGANIELTNSTYIASTNAFDNCFILASKCYILFGSNLTWGTKGTFTDCTITGLNIISAIAAFPLEFNNCLFTKEICGYSDDYHWYIPSYLHNKTTGFKAWSKGGTVASQTTVMPSGYSIAYIQTMNGFTNIFKKYINVPAGESASVEVQLRKTTTMTYLPRVYLMNSFSSPFADDSDAEDSFIMTDSTDTWESDTFTIDNSAGTIDKQYTLWFLAKNATGSVYSAYDITTQGGTGGGGAVSIQPVSGRLGL